MTGRCPFRLEDTFRTADLMAFWQWNGKDIPPEFGWDGGLLLLVNVQGQAEFQRGRKTEEILPGRIVAGVGLHGMKVRRAGKGPHRFLCFAATPAWMEKWNLHTIDEGFFNQTLNGTVGKSTRDFIEEPLAGPCQPAWREAKAVEIATHALTPTTIEVFPVTVKNHLATRRVDQVKQLLADNLEHPPTLAQLGKMAGCSPFHLSRIFSEQTGTTITRHLRDLRLEKAAAILREGKSNVTEAAMEVGYSSLSHFSKAFAEKFSICPYAYLLFALNPPAAKAPDPSTLLEQARNLPGPSGHALEDHIRKMMSSPLLQPPEKPKIPVKKNPAKR
ncbi:MAG: helix-turn-helix domain-containing protein [Verrucomicrobiota bacterium]